MATFVIAAALFFVLAGIVLYAVAVYNSLIAVKNDVSKAWANIDVLLKQRHDELPKLIKTCEAYMKYEQETLRKIVELRSSALATTGVAERAQKEGELTAALSKLFALAENYPELKSEATFGRLQDRISGLESQIADRREFYNEAVNNYNTRIDSLPDVFFARLMGLRPQEWFKAADEERRDVDVHIHVPA